MSPDAIFVAAYSVLLLALSAGLHRLGRVNSYAWTSRALAGHRRAAGDPAMSNPRSDWPHSEVPRLHTGIALVAASAATLLTTVELIHHHHASEALVLGALLLICIGALTRLAAGLR